MRDPERLLSGDASELERMLLDAAARERPAPELRFRMRHAIGLPAIVATTSAKAALVAWGHTAVVAVVAAGLLGTASSPMRPAAPASVERAVAHAPVALGRAETKSPPVERPAPVEEQTVPAPAAVLPKKMTRTAQPKVSEPPAASPPEAASDSQVNAEILLLDQVRVALRRGHPERAVSRLAIYTERFPRGVFRQEATVLRIEAMRQSGDQAQATRLAQEFVARHPESPHTQRVIGSVPSAKGTR